MAKPRKNIVTDFMAETVKVGLWSLTRHDALAAMQADGFDNKAIDFWVFGNGYKRTDEPSISLEQYQSEISQLQAA